MDEERSRGIGHSVRRVEDSRLTTGRGRFGNDLSFPEALHMTVLRSPHAHARILSMDASQALELPGVVAVFNGEDLQRDGLGHLPTRVVREAPGGGPCFIPPFPALAVDVVRHVGEAVAVVIADSPNAGKDALDLVEVDFEPLPSVTDVSEATQTGAVEIWPEVPRNECFLYQAGDSVAVERAFDRAHHVTRLEFRVSRVHAAPLETRNAVGVYDPFTERYTLYSADQSPHVLRNELAEKILKVPEHQVQICTPECGGSFGMKYGPYPEQVLVLWASRKLGRPIRWSSERNEAFLADHHARDNASVAELALDEDGRFLALRVRTLANLGAYINAYGIHTPTNNVGGLAGTYTTPHIFVSVKGVFTNTVPIAAYRGAGRPEASYAIERIIDIAAAEMGIDRIELRRRNMIPPESMPFRTGLLYTYDSGEFEKNMDRALELSDWREFGERRKVSAAAGKLRGIGLASVIEVAGGPLESPAEEFAEVRFDPSGHVLVLVGTTSQGQGHETMVKQLLSEFLGVPQDRVRVAFGDTDQVPFGRGTFGSRAAAAVGECVRVASEKLVKRGTDIAAQLLEVGTGDIEFRDGWFSAAGTDYRISIGEVARAVYSNDARLKDLPRGFYESATISLPAPTFPNGCHVCEVEIDEETGTLEIVGYWVVDDIGRVINPMMAKGQLIGGIVQGIGQAIGEVVLYDDHGQLLTATFQDYTMPRADLVPNIVVESNQVPAKTNPLGIKGAGEAGTVGALPAVMNAVNHALQPRGVRHFEMPATACRLWEALSRV